MTEDIFVWAFAFYEDDNQGVFRRLQECGVCFTRHRVSPYLIDTEESSRPKGCTGRLPEMVLVNNDGRLVERFNGDIDAHEVRQRIIAHAASEDVNAVQYEIFGQIVDTKPLDVILHQSYISPLEMLLTKIYNCKVIRHDLGAQRARELGIDEHGALAYCPHGVLKNWWNKPSLDLVLRECVNYLTNPARYASMPIDGGVRVVSLNKVLTPSYYQAPQLRLIKKE